MCSFRSLFLTFIDQPGELFSNGSEVLSYPELTFRVGCTPRVNYLIRVHVRDQILGLDAYTGPHPWFG